MYTIGIEVGRRNHAYDIVIATGSLARWRGEVDKRLGAGRRLVVADGRVDDIRGIGRSLAGSPEWILLRAEAGETRKNLEQYGELCEKALAAGIDRGTVVVAIGGGVVGDIAGFMAATLLRGLRLVQIPTTLLAQVDSSVGGKTGVNAAGGKNLIGAFHQPEFVLVDPAALDSLPDREYRAGLAEVLKYGVIGDGAFVASLRASARLLARRDGDTLAAAIERCCRMKAAIVAEDERERGARALLNLGHTFGHALEAIAGYDGRVVHGEAVAVGMALAAGFAAEARILPPSARDDIIAALSDLGLPRRIADLGRRGEEIAWREALQGEKLFQALARDKKAGGGMATLVLPTAVGECRIVHDVPVSKVAAFMQAAS